MQNYTLYDWVSESQLTTTVDGVQVTATWLVSAVFCWLRVKSQVTPHSKGGVHTRCQLQKAKVMGATLCKGLPPKTGTVLSSSYFTVMG